MDVVRLHVAFATVSVAILTNHLLAYVNVARKRSPVGDEKN